MINLPEDCVFNIFSFFDEKSLVKSSEVCQKWKEVSESDLNWQHLWKRTFVDCGIEKPLSGSYKNDYFQAKKFSYLKLGGANSQLVFKNNESRHPVKRIPVRDCNRLLMQSGKSFNNISISPPSFDKLASKNYLGELLTDFQGVGFFSTLKYKEFFALNWPPLTISSRSNLIDIVDLKTNNYLATIDIHDALVKNVRSYVTPMYDEILESCAAAFVDKSIFMTLSYNGYLTEWDISDLRKPVFVKTEQILEDDQILRAAVKCDEYLIMSLLVGKQRILKVHHLKTKINDSRSISFDESEGLLISDNIIIEVKKESIRAHEMVEGSLKPIWEKEIVDNRTGEEYMRGHLLGKKDSFFHWDFNHFKEHPYIMKIERVKVVDGYKNTGFSVFSGLDGKEIIHMAISEKNQYIEVQADVVMIKEPDEMTLMALPSGFQRSIFKKPEGGSFSWDGDNLIHQYDRYSNRFFREFDYHLNIYQSTKALPPTTGKGQSERLIVPPLSRKQFAYFTLVNLATSIPFALIHTIKNILKVSTLFDIWGPLFAPITFSARLLNFSHSLLKIVYLPLLLVGLQFSLISGIASPIFGENWKDFFSAKIETNT